MPLLPRAADHCLADDQVARPERGIEPAGNSEAQDQPEGLIAPPLKRVPQLGHIAP
jgi:hypothetical protein